MTISGSDGRRTGAGLTAALLAALCLALVAMLLARLLAPAPTVAPLPASVALVPDIERVGRLFGVPGQTPEAAATQPTDPSLRLIGVIVERERSLALISVNGGPARALPIGAPLGLRNRLVGIGTDRAIVEREDGRQFELRVPVRGSSSEAGGGRDAGRTQVRPTPPAAPPAAGR